LHVRVGVDLADLSIFILYWLRRQATHERRLRQYKVRVHVNGIRGKSTVTRLIAGVLRKPAIEPWPRRPFGAVMIDFDGHDQPSAPRCSQRKRATGHHR